MPPLRIGDRVQYIIPTIPVLEHPTGYTIKPGVVVRVSPRRVILLLDGQHKPMVARPAWVHREPTVKSR